MSGSEARIQQSSSAERLLVFSLGDEEYCISLSQVKEVIAPPRITPIPKVPPYFLGMMDLRGTVVAVIDLRTKLGMPRRDPMPEMAIIILDLGSKSLGVVVDSVNHVLTLD